MRYQWSYNSLLQSHSHHLQDQRYVAVSHAVSIEMNFIKSLYENVVIHGANMGPTWVLSAPDGPHVGPMNLAIRVFAKDDHDFAASRLH